MTERYIIDDAGTLIDIETRNTYDYVSEICPILNEVNDENKQLKNKLQTYKTSNSLLKATMDRHRTENQQIRDTIKEMYNNERTELGKSTLKQLLETIQ